MVVKGKNPEKRTVDDLWIRMVGMTPENKQALLNERGIDLTSIDDMQDDENYLYLPLRVMVGSAEGIAQRRPLMIIMGEHHLITVQDTENFPPFQSAFRHIRRHPETLRNPKALLCLILHVLNEQASKVIAAVGASLEESSDTISEVTRSLNTGNSAMGIVDINEMMIDLNKKEELVSRCLESQLSLARAARYLDMEVTPTDELQIFVRSLRDDINGVKEHAAFEHDSVRYLQNAILASLNVKQNQIVKVFTIITAVFLPPTLIASIYGMNFAVMPELSWEHGFPVSILLTLVAALLPLVYIKRRGWLR
jgi:magnesium transporter